MSVWYLVQRESLSVVVTGLFVSGMLIGINLTELAKIGLEGVNEFRWSAKLWASKIAVERQDLMTEDRRNVLVYQYPAKLIESSYSTNIVEKRRSLIREIFNLENI